MENDAVSVFQARVEEQPAESYRRVFLLTFTSHVNAWRPVRILFPLREVQNRLMILISYLFLLRRPPHHTQRPRRGPILRR